MHAERIMQRVEYDTNGGCWLWTGHTSGPPNNLRPRLYLTPSTSVLAHRASYETFRGALTPATWVLHRCDVTLCVNPDHLFLGGRQDNVDDMCRKGRQARGSKNGQAKLSESDIALIRSSTAPKEDLAAQYGVRPGHITRLRCGGRWGHLPGSRAAAVAYSQRTHCPAGHAYDDENTYRWRTQRGCRACRREQKSVSRAGA